MNKSGAAKIWVAQIRLLYLNFEWIFQRICSLSWLLLENLQNCGKARCRNPGFNAARTNIVVKIGTQISCKYHLIKIVDQKLLLRPFLRVGRREKNQTLAMHVAYRVTTIHCHLLITLNLPYHNAVILSLNRDVTLQFKATM